jgi:hypothetical protein
MADKTWIDGDIITASDLNNLLRDQTITRCLSSARPTTSAIGRFIFETDTQSLWVWLGYWYPVWSKNEWTAYTPTLQNITLGTGGSIKGRKKQVGLTVSFGLQIQLGVGGSLNAPAATFTLPVPVGGNYNGTFSVLAANAGGAHSATGNFIQGSAVSGWMFTNNNPINATSPFTWVANDLLIVSGSYEVDTPTVTVGSSVVLLNNPVWNLTGGSIERPLIEGTTSLQPLITIDAVTLQNAGSVFVEVDIDVVSGSGFATFSQQFWWAASAGAYTTSPPGTGTFSAPVNSGGTVVPVAQYPTWVITTNGNERTLNVANRVPDSGSTAGVTITTRTARWQ